MKRIFIILACFLVARSALSQSTGEELRQDKIQLIMRLQDRRTVHDGKLTALLSDADPPVRERAVRAYGSIQDTTVLSLLVEALSDNNSDVQYSAAFAIGQTARLLSRESAETVAHDLIWARLDKVDPLSTGESRTGVRLVEEIGKFGTEDALKDLVLRYGTNNSYANALTMSIARFAVRNITSDDAVQFLLRHIRPAESTSWQAVYALQRVGNHRLLRSDLDEIIQLDKHTDPLVRMNLAVLLGKIRNEAKSLEPLQKLALFDSDWRVRVNALKALANFNIQRHDDVIDLFRRSFYDQNLSIALTALSSFGNAAGKEMGSSAAVEALGGIAKNENGGYPWQLQAEAATALAKVAGKDALPYIRPSDQMYQLLKARLLRALGESGAPEALDLLVPYAGKDDPMMACAALEGLLSLSKKNKTNSNVLNRTYEVTLGALSHHDVAVVTTVAAILGDSLFLRFSSVEPLVTLLSACRVPDDIEAMQEISATLGKLKDGRALPVLINQLSQPDRSVVLAAALALQSITGKEYVGSVPPSFEPLWTDFDFPYLNSLRDSSCFHYFREDTVCVKLETIRGDVVVELYKNCAPFTVMAILKLATQRAFYRGLSFHRVDPNFVVQGGDPRGDGWGGPGFSIRSEFSPLTYETGTLGMASAGKDTEGSQFFITQSPQPHLDGRYTLFGKVISGMEVVDKLQVGDHILDIKVLP